MSDQAYAQWLIKQALDTAIESGFFVLKSDIDRYIKDALESNIHRFKGDAGERGPSAQFPIAISWKSGVYLRGDVVEHNGSTWQADVKTDREPGIENSGWHTLAEKGERGRSITNTRIENGELHITFDYEEEVNTGPVEGPQGIGIHSVSVDDGELKFAFSDGREFNYGRIVGPAGTSTVFLGKWSTDTPYDKQQMVAWDGCTWIAPEGAEKGEEPGKSPKWRISAMKGARGKTGSQGFPGKDGKQGVKGDPGNDGKQGVKGDPGKDGADITSVDLIYDDGPVRLSVKWANDKSSDVTIDTIRWRGAYDPRKKYWKGDTIRFGNVVWVAKKNVKGRNPNPAGGEDENWDVMLGGDS